MKQTIARHDDAVMWQRTLRAAAVLALAFGALAASGMLVSTAFADRSVSSPLALTDDQGTAVAWFDLVQGVATNESAFSTDLPACVTAEVLIPADATDAVSMANDRVIGYSVAGDDSANVIERISAGMQACGWTAAPVSGQTASVAFFKETGDVRYVLATCFQMSESVSVVLQVSYAEGGW